MAWQDPLKGGYHSAVSDPDLVHIWFGVFFSSPAIGYAIPPNRIVIDLDARASDSEGPGPLGETHPELAQALLDANTFVVKTRHGWHHHFCLPEGVEIAQTSAPSLRRAPQHHIRRLLDIKAGGKGYTILPPTSLGNLQYEYRGGDIDNPAELPQIWVEALIDWPLSQSGSIVPDGGDGSVSLRPSTFHDSESGLIPDVGDVQPAGTPRHPILFTEACRVRSLGWAEPEIRSAITAMNERMFEDPKPQHLIDEMVRDVCDRYVRGERPQQSEQTPDDETVDETDARPRASTPEQQETNDRIRVRDSAGGTVVVISPLGPEVTITGIHRRGDERSQQLLGAMVVRLTANADGVELTFKGGILCKGIIDAEGVRSRVEWSRHCNFRTTCASPAADVDENNSRGESKFGLWHWLAIFDNVVEAMSEMETPETGAIDAVDLLSEPVDTELDIHGWQFAPNRPALLYGDGSTGKSTMATWLMLEASNIDPSIKPLYIDWETSAADIGGVLRRLDPHLTRGRMGYIQCMRPITEELDRIAAAYAANGYNYAIIDSVTPATAGRAESPQAVIETISAIRRALGGGFLLISHEPRVPRTSRHAFGSVHWVNQVRRAWRVVGQDQDDNASKRIGIWRVKSNNELGDYGVGFRVRFDEDRITVGEDPDGVYRPRSTVSTSGGGGNARQSRESNTMISNIRARLNTRADRSMPASELATMLRTTTENRTFRRAIERADDVTTDGGRWENRTVTLVVRD